jgi:DNA repair protein RadC
MKLQMELKDMPPASVRVYNPKEYKVVCVRECVERDNLLADTPEGAAEYYRRHIKGAPSFNRDVESFCVLLLNTRRRIKAHALVANGTLDTILVHPREVFRPAIVASAAAIILMHNHPSGEPTPSEADIKVTRDLIKAGTIVKIEVLDHVVMGDATAASPKDFCSLRELGYFFN